MNLNEEEIIRLNKDNEYMEAHMISLEREPFNEFECVPGYEFYKKLLEE